MIDYTSVPVIIAIVIALLAIIALHVLSLIFRNGREKIFMLVNILLHALLVVPALFLTNAEGEAVELEVVVLFYILSALFYTAGYFITEQIERYRERPAVAEKEEDCDL